MPSSSPSTMSPGATGHPAQAIVTTPIEHEDGVVQIPDGPGLGIEIDRAALERFRVD